MCGSVNPMKVLRSALTGGIIGGGAGALEMGGLNTAAQAFAAPSPPGLAKTPLAPVMDAEAIAKQRQLTLAKMLSSGGRNSTILTQPTNSGTLG